MSTFDDNDDQLDGENTGEKKVTVARSHIRHLEDKAKRADDADALEKEVALLRLGVDTNTPAGKMLLTHPDVKLDNLDAVKALATDLGLLKTEGDDETGGDEQQQQIPPAEQAQTRERQQLVQGAQSDGVVERDPYEAGFEAFDKARAQGQRREDAAAGFIDSVFVAAKKGDQRVLIGDRLGQGSGPALPGGNG